MELKHMLSKLRADIFVRRNTADGGPGSGNWGHAGRPGKVGGSAKGNGGKQYRGGRADIGYFNSRNDWLNGLSGEKQSRASEMLKKVKEKIPPTSDVTPEEYIMKNWPVSGKEHFLGLVGEARSWEDRGFQLQEENLSSEEKGQLYNLMADLDMRFGGEDGYLNEKEWLHSNLDRMFGLMDDEEQDFYLDMKAKACGLPTSGKEPESYSRKFQKEIGVLNEGRLPMSDEENKDWGIFMSDKDGSELGEIASRILGENAGAFVKRSNMNDIESEMLSAVQDHLDDSDGENRLQAFGEYLEKKDEILNGDFFKSLSGVPDKWSGGDSGVGRLRRFDTCALRDALNEFNKGSGLNIDDNGKEMEAAFLSNKDVPIKARAAYLGLKALALGTPEDGNGSGYSRRCTINNEINKKQFAERQVKINEERERKLKEYGAQKRPVVIKGDEMSERVNSMRNDSGVYSNDELKKIGDVMVPELEKALSDAAERKKRMEEIRKEYHDLDWAASSGRQNGETDEEYVNRKREARAKADEAWKRFTAARAEEQNRNVVSEMLSRVREVGFKDEKAMKEHFEGRSTVKPFIEKAYQFYPTEWVVRSLAQGSVTTRKVKRGYYSPGEIAISGEWDGDKTECAIHELGHRFEECMPGIVKAEADFYKKRTEGEESISLRKLTGNKSYAAHEVTKRDKFINPYIGKDYGRDSYEIVSMGFQYAFHEPNRLLQDREYAQLILGLLAVG